MPKALRIFSCLLLTGILILGGGAGYLWWKKEVIIDRSIERLNKELNAPISVGSIDLDLFSGFPRVRVELVDVEIKDALRPNTALLRAEYVGLGMNILEVIKGTFVIEELAFKRGTFSLYENGSGQNWELLSPSATSSEQSIDLSRISLIDMDLRYEDGISKDIYSGYANNVVLTGGITQARDLQVDGRLSKVYGSSVQYEWFRELSLSGSIELTLSDNGWNANSNDLILNNSAISFNLNESGGRLFSSRIDIATTLTNFPMLTLGDVVLTSCVSSLNWKGTYDDWTAEFTPSKCAFTFDALNVLDAQGKLFVKWGSERAISGTQLIIKTSTGELQGSITLSGLDHPVLQSNLSGGSNLNELFQLVEVTALDDPMGFWQGQDLQINQQFKSWSDFTPTGETDFSGSIQLTQVAFGISESTISFEKVEADLRVSGDDILLDRCFLQSGMNTAVVEGQIVNALHSFATPRIQVTMESPIINVDPLLFWEFDDKETSSDGFGFDFEINLNIAALTLGDFEGNSLRGMLFNDGTVIHGKEMEIQGCQGTIKGDWTLTEQTNGSIFWTNAVVQSIALDELLRSFNSFDIEDIDESNLKGQVSSTAEMTLSFNNDWDVVTEKTKIDAVAVLRNGTLQHYSPLQELSSFVDKDELSTISIPLLQGPFNVRGDTLFIPETEVENSAMNFWVNGWQNLKTDEISYGLRLGVKDLALRGKNSNRDLGGWISESENENQPYVRILVGCDLDDPCVSLDKTDMARRMKNTLKKERDDLKTLFQAKPDDEKDQNPASGSFELLWPESDSLQVKSYL
tara:strand:- start:5740 stop:8148 length:2409 start_codon:yes stop_codon:yes gene_type:complete